MIFIQIDLVCTAEPPRCLLFSYSLTWSTLVKALLSANSAGQELQNPALSFLPVQLSSSKTSVLPSFPCHRSPGRGALGSFHGLKTVPNHRVRFTMGSPPPPPPWSHMEHGCIFSIRLETRRREFEEASWVPPSLSSACLFPWA